MMVPPPSPIATAEPFDPEWPKCRIMPLLMSADTPPPLGAFGKHGHAPEHAHPEEVRNNPQHNGQRSRIGRRQSVGRKGRRSAVGTSCRGSANKCGRERPPRPSGDKEVYGRSVGSGRRRSWRVISRTRPPPRARRSCRAQLRNVRRRAPPRLGAMADSALVGAWGPSSYTNNSRPGTESEAPCCELESRLPFQPIHHRQHGPQKPSVKHTFRHFADL